MYIAYILQHGLQNVPSSYRDKRIKYINQRSQNNFILQRTFAEKRKSNYAEGIERSRDNPIDREQREKGGVMAK